MKSFGLARCLIAIALLTFARAGMAQECPVSEIGSPCSVSGIGRTCIGAHCTDTVDGSTVVRPCAACVSLPPNTCSDAGQECGDGGTCANVSGSMSGGSTQGGPSSSVDYAYAECEYPSDAGTPKGPGDLSGDGGNSGNSASGASGGSAANSGGSGCAVSLATVAGPHSASGWTLLILAALRRRRADPLRSQPSGHAHPDLGGGVRRACKALAIPLG